MRCLLAAAACLLVAAAVVPVAGAAPIDPGVLYQLNNHPDGSEAEPFYGLRLDGLMGDVDEEWTFDFDHPDSQMTMLWDDMAATLDISGVTFGGEDEGAQYDPATTALWQIDFRYTNVLDAGAQLQVPELNGPFGLGTIKNLSTQQVFQLIDTGSGTTFFVGGDHRGFDGVSGWGWLNHSGAPGGLGEHVYSSDWIFTVGTALPEPSAGMLMGGSLLISCFVSPKRE
jgi:hypothetical protein